MGLFDIFNKKEEPAPIQTKAKKETEKHRIAGTAYNQDALMSFAKKNDLYSLDKRGIIKNKLSNQFIYEYIFTDYSAQFEFEPENPKDPNAIKVLADGKHIGYIKKGSTGRVRNLIENNGFESAVVHIYGGNSKCYDSDIDEMQKDSGDIKAEVIFALK